MARRSRRRSTNTSVKRQTTRDARAVATPRVRRLPAPRSLGSTGDRRRFSFTVTTPRMRDSHSSVTSTQTSTSTARGVGLLAQDRPAFHNPRATMICKRRNERREVLFAKGVGGGKVRKGKRNQWSSIVCRR